MLLVVVYDIANDTRRVRLHTFLLGYCDAVQESVFECLVDESQRRTLQAGVRRLTRRAADRVRYYRLCATCAANVEDRDGPAAGADPPSFVV